MFDDIGSRSPEQTLQWQHRWGLLVFLSPPLAVGLFVFFLYRRPGDFGGGFLQRRVSAAVVGALVLFVRIVVRLIASFLSSTGCIKANHARWICLRPEPVGSEGTKLGGR